MISRSGGAADVRGAASMSGRVALRCAGRPTASRRATPLSIGPLATRNYRLYFSGQLISVPGTWLQTVAQAWLVLQLTPSGSALGITVALQALPVLLLGPWAGAVADRGDKRRLLLGTQAGGGGRARGPRLAPRPGAAPLPPGSVP